MEHEQVKHFFDAVSIAGVVATLAGWLPSIAALLSIMWTIIRIWETKTVRELVKKVRG